MSLNNPKGGIGYAAEFQSSALPFVTTSQAPAPGVNAGMRISFPKITRFINLQNLESAGHAVRLAFTLNGLATGSPGGYHVKVDGGRGIDLEVRVKEIWLCADSAGPALFSLCAGLTNIDQSAMPLLSGTLADGTPGWTGVG